MGSSYGTLCSDFKQSGLDAPEKKPQGGGANEDATGKAKGKGKDKDAKGKGKASGGGGGKKKKPKGLLAVEWFRIGALPAPPSLPRSCRLARTAR